jgi:hypothetical protein
LAELSASALDNFFTSNVPSAGGMFFLIIGAGKEKVLE